MAFRASGKSTIVGLFSAWLLWRDPDLRILVLAAESSLARKMVRNIRKVIERHPLTRALRPNNPDQWAADRFTINRNLELRDPSVLGAGILSNITGSRADLIICDDVEVPKTCDTALKREALRERLHETEYILTPQGTQVYIGTPHSWYSIYADEPRKEIGEEQPFLNSYDRMMVPLVSDQGVSAWPERYAPEDIDRMKTETGPNKFASQMMLRPVNILEGRLDPENLVPYEGELEYSEAQKKAQLHLNGRRLVSCSACWDPAFGTGSGDSSVLAIVYTDEEGEYWLHHLAYINVSPDLPEDEATQQCRIVAALAGRFYVPSISLEINGIGRFLPSILRKELAKARIPSAVIEVSNRRPKDVRILEAFDAVLAARALNVHENAFKTPFINEMLEWRPGVAGLNDDGLDAVAGALSAEPVRLKKSYMSGRTYWQGSSLSYQAQTDFNI